MREGKDEGVTDHKQSRHELSCRESEDCENAILSNSEGDAMVAAAEQEHRDRLHRSSRMHNGTPSKFISILRIVRYYIVAI